MAYGTSNTAGVTIESRNFYDWTMEPGSSTPFGWGSWITSRQTATLYQDSSAASNSCKVCYKITVDANSWDEINSVTMKLYATSNGVTIGWRLYDFDPTTSSSKLPSGHLKSGTKNVSGTVYFNIAPSGLSTDSLHLYLLIWVSSTGANSKYIDIDTSAPVLTATGVQPTPTLSLSPTTVTAGGNITLSIGKRAGRTLTVLFKYGNTQLKSQSVSADSTTVTCPLSWFTTANQKTASQMTVTVSISGYNVSKTFTLNNKLPTLSATANVMTGEKVTITVTNLESRTFTLKLMEPESVPGEEPYVYTSVSINTATKQITCEASWFGNSTSNSMIIAAELDGYPGSRTTFTLKKPTISVSPSSLTAGGNLTVTISNRGSKTLTLKLKNGSTVLASQSVSSNSASVNCPVSWFATIGSPAASSMTITVQIDGETNTGATKTFTLNNLIPTVSVSPSSVSTGNSVSITIGNMAGRTLIVEFKYGSTALDSMNASADVVSKSCPKSWFTTAGVTTLKNITVTVNIYLASGASVAATATFTLTAGDNMKPTVYQPTVSCVQQAPASTNYPNTFIRGLSKAKVSVKVVAGSNAAISTVSCVYENNKTLTLTYNSTSQKYEGTTDVLSADTSFTVTVTDARGMSASGTSNSITVLQYVAPVITVDASGTYRCNSSGTKSQGGTYFKVKATAGLYTEGALSTNSIVKFTVMLSGSQSETNITSGTQTSAISTNVSSKAAMTLIFTLKDRVGYEVTKTYILYGGGQYITTKTVGEDGGVSIGVGKDVDNPSGAYSLIDVSTAGLDKDYPGKLGFLINGMNLTAFQTPMDEQSNGEAFGKDFLNVNMTNPIAQENATEWFYKPNSATGWMNVPTTFATAGWVGIRMVFRKSSSTAMVVVIEESPVAGRIWFCRKHSGGSWEEWRYITSTAA